MLKASEFDEAAIGKALPMRDGEETYWIYQARRLVREVAENVAANDGTTDDVRYIIQANDVQVSFLSDLKPRARISVITTARVCTIWP